LVLVLVLVYPFFFMVCLKPQLSSAEMGVLTAQQMFAYMQAQLTLPQHQQGAGSGTAGAQDSLECQWVRWTSC